MRLVSSLQVATRFVPFYSLDKKIGAHPHDFTMTFSNAGIIDEDCVHFGSLPVTAAHISSAATASPRFCLTISTFRGAPTLTMSTKGNEEREAFVRRLLSSVADELVALGAQGDAEGT
jgi:NRPS condensation-like uncharacterized protein